MFGSKLKVAAGVFAGTMLAGGLAFAAIPGTDGTITACYTKQAGLFSPQGSLRVVNSPSECRASEVALNWNQQGQPGPAGPAGQDGEDGLDGLPGAPGQDGLDGQDGQPGPVGPAGRDGIDGQDGADGQDGLPGPVGPVGPAGPPGISAAKVVWSERTYVYGEFKDVATMTLPKGSYVIQANVTWDIPGSDNPWTTGWHPWVHCELREGTNVIGFGGDRRASLSRQGPVTATIPIHGGAIISGDTGTASVECKGSETEHVRVQMVAMQIGGFL